MKILLLVLLMTSSTYANDSGEYVVTGEGQGRNITWARQRAQKQRAEKIIIFEEECLAKNGSMEVLKKWTMHRRQGKRIYKAVSKANLICHYNN